MKSIQNIIPPLKEETGTQQQKKYPNSNKLLLFGIIIFLILTLIVVFMPVFVTQFSLISLKVEKPNEIGDTIGGILGPCVALIAAALTFLAFWAQFDANVEQRKQFDVSLSIEKTARLEEKERMNIEQEKQSREYQERQEQFELEQQLQQDQILLQDKRSKIDLFETRFYTMLSIHRDNANNIEVNNIKGRKVFLHMLDELRLLYEIFCAINNSNKVEGEKLDSIHLYNIAYLSFFFGIGEKSTPLVKDLVNDSSKTFVEEAHTLITSEIEVSKKLNKLKIEINANNQLFSWDKVYSFGVGHLRRLSHYIRHLFQIVKFVDDQPRSLLNQEEKYNYISNLRAQLSVHEQLLLFYNAISVLGKPWTDLIGDNDENYIERYCLLKSVPLNSADFYQKPEDRFQVVNKKGKAMFEWMEIKSRMDKLSEVVPHKEEIFL